MSKSPIVAAWQHFRQLELREEHLSQFTAGKWRGAEEDWRKMSGKDQSCVLETVFRFTSRELAYWRLVQGVQAGFDPNIWGFIAKDIKTLGLEDVDFFFQDVPPLAKKAAQYMLEGKKRNYVWVKEGLCILRETFPRACPITHRGAEV